MAPVERIEEAIANGVRAGGIVATMWQAVHECESSIERRTMLVLVWQGKNEIGNYRTYHRAVFSYDQCFYQHLGDNL